MFGKERFRARGSRYWQNRRLAPASIRIWWRLRGLMRDVPRWVWAVDDDPGTPDIDPYDWYKDMEFEE